MAANSDPIYSKAADIQHNTALITTVAGTPFDAVGTIGTDIYLVFTADATNGGFVQRLRIKYIGSALSIATVLKIFVSDIGTGTTTNANTRLIGEIALPAFTPAAATAAPDVDYPLNFPIPAGKFILAKTTVGQTASNGYQVVAIGGKY